jgi:hypothetical protein
MISPYTGSFRLQAGYWGNTMKYLAVMLCGATLLSGCYFEEDDISSSDRQEQLPIVQNDAPQGTRVVPGEQVMSSGRYRNDIQVANGAAAIKATSEHYGTTAEISVIQ